MTTQAGSNVQVAAVEGNFDDAQSAVKRIFGDRALAERLAGNSHVVLSSANSINVGRLVPQVVYYFSAYAQLLADQVINVGDEVEFVVPTGNFGDILAGYYAKLLGLPVKHLVVASDKNNVLFDFLTTGTYNRQRPFFQTISPSMDILISSNLERMLYYLSEGDTRLISMLMNDLNKWGTYEIPEELLAKIRQIFGTGWADEDQVRESIKHCWDENHYVIDPHTACGYYLLEQMPRDPLTPRVLLSTASPYKFPRAGERGIGFDATGTDFECMDVLAHETGTTAPAACVVLRPPTCGSRTSWPSTAWKITSKRPPRRCDSPLTALTDNSQPIHALPACIGFLFSDVTSRRSRHVQACPSLVTRGFLAAFHLQRANGVLLVFSRKRESPCCRRTGKSMWFVRFCFCN